MAITYPLNTPTNIGIANITLMAENAVAVSQSPFTFAQQVVAHPGQRWAASVSLPPMKRVDAENWIAFLLSLKGQVGTFLLGDPNAVNDQGIAAARRNLLLYTEQLSNAYWLKTRCTISADAIVAPDGTTTADTMVEDTSSSTHTISRSITTFEAGKSYTFSMYIKAQSTRNIRIDLPSNLFGTTASYFDPNTGTLITTSGSPTTTITSVGNGWYRVSCSKVCVTSGTGNVQFYTVTGTTTVSYTGDGVSGIYIWGLQLEEGAAPTSYQGVVDTFGPLVNGAGQTGNTLNIDGCSPNTIGWFAPGDYIQLGTGSGTQLYKVLTRVDTNNSGQATLDIWPNLRSSPADNASVVFTNTKGRFRLKDNIAQWQINEISSYGITFDCVEAL